MGSPDLNLDSMGLTLGGDLSFDSTVNLGGMLSINLSDMTIVGDPNRPITTQIQGNPLKPVATTVELINLPRFSLQDIKDLKTGRIRLPHYNQMCFKILGIDLFSLCFSGESQVISEPYEPNAYEKCEIPCCTIDTRPFPD